jgi:hypothetical protein
MAEKMSTYLCNYLLSTGGIRQVFNAANVTELRILTGAVPATADAAQTGTVAALVIGTATNLSFAASSTVGVLAKETAVWADTTGTNAGGVATYYRLVQHGDAGALNQTGTFTDARIQGTIGLTGTDMIVGNTTIAANAAFTVNTFSQSILPS